MEQNKLTNMFIENPEEISLKCKLEDFQIIRNFSEKNIKILNNAKKQQGFGKSLGNYYSCMNKKSTGNFIALEINIELSNFILNEIEQELISLKQNKEIFDISLLPITYNYEPSIKKLVFFFNFYEDTSLRNLIQSEGNNDEKRERFPLNLKKKIIKQLAFSLKDFHKNFIYHGHLHPNNIFFDRNFNIKIADFTFLSLRKFCVFSCGYSNKSQFSSPEILLEKSLIANNPNEKNDVYSFGLILAEILTEKIPFDKVDLNLLIKLVCDDDCRPKLFNNINEKYLKLIRTCWQKNPDKRPTFDQICQIINEIN